MEEPNIPDIPETDKIGRREFLIKIAATTASLGSCGLLTACLDLASEEPSATREPTATEVYGTKAARPATVPEANATADKRVAATSETRTGADFNKEMEKIPENVRRSAMRTELHFDGSGPILTSSNLLDVRDGIAYILTAGHSFVDIDEAFGNPVQIAFDQPHLNQRMEIPISRSDIGFATLYSDDRTQVTNDVGILAVNLKDSSPQIQPLTNSNLLENWQPNTIENLHLLGFSDSAEATQGIYPANFRLIPFPGGELIDFHGLFTTNAAISQGISGAVVANDSGKAIGVISSFDRTSGNTFINPLDNIQGLIQDAQKQIQR